MSGREWSPPEDSHTDFVVDAERGTRWSRHEQDAPEYVPQGQLRVEWGSSEYIPVSPEGVDEYEGPYAASARFSDQSFDTARKLMRDDFSVRAINYTEAPNGSGVTVTIGG